MNDELATMKERIDYMRSTIGRLNQRLQTFKSNPLTSLKAKVFESPMKYAERFPNFAEIVVETIKFQETSDRNPSKLLPLIDRLETELKELPKHDDDPMNARLQALLGGLRHMKEKLQKFVE